MSLLRCAGIALLLIFLVPAMSPAQQLSLLHNAALSSSRAPFVNLRPSSNANRPGGGSLFIGKQGGSLFAPFAPRTKPRQEPLAPATSQVGRVLDLIARAEAGSKGYDAVQHGAKIKPVKPPTQLTIQGIYDWIDATPGQHHAIGRYQFIPSTLKFLVARAGVSPKAVFTPAVQDRLADLLLQDAGLSAFRAGNIGRHAFMNNLAKIWAGLPNSSGQSHYHGLAGNKATMTWAYFDAEMSRIFAG